MWCPKQNGISVWCVWASEKHMTGAHNQLRWWSYKQWIQKFYCIWSSQYHQNTLLVADVTSRQTLRSQVTLHQGAFPLDSGSKQASDSCQQLWRLLLQRILFCLFDHAPVRLLYALSRQSMPSELEFIRLGAIEDHIPRYGHPYFRFSKILKKLSSSAETAKVGTHHILHLRGILQDIVSDRGSHSCKLLRTKVSQSSWNWVYATRGCDTSISDLPCNLRMAQEALTVSFILWGTSR